MNYRHYSYGEQIEYAIERLTTENYDCVKDFECGNEVINEYLKKKALHDMLGTTYVIIDKNDGIALGYCTICCSGITHKYQNSVRTLPSIEIRYFAIINRLHKLQFSPDDAHYYFSDHMMYSFMYYCADITSNTIAAQYIILYSVPDAIKFYERVGFCKFSEFYERNTYKYLDGCEPMYIQIP